MATCCAPAAHDPSLPKPDLQNKNLMAMTPATGALQLIRTDGSKFPNGTNVGDQVCWGTMTKFGCKVAQNLQSFEKLSNNCSVLRKPRACSTAKTIADPSHAHHYQGNGHWSGLYAGDDWVVYCPRKPRNSSNPPQRP